MARKMVTGERCQKDVAVLSQSSDEPHGLSSALQLQKEASAKL
jgi:hypothetical protein